MPRRYAETVPAQPVPQSGAPLAGGPRTGGPPPYAGPRLPAPPGRPAAPPALSPAGAPLASFVDRLIARLIDSLILGALTLMVLVPVLVIALIVFFDAGQREVRVNEDPFAPLPPDEPTALAVILVAFGLIMVEIVIALLLAYLYDVEAMFRSGQTIGKRIMNIRVVRLDPAAPLTRGVAAKRYLIQHVVAVVVPAFNLLDGLWQLWDKPLQQCLHDKYATTVVVKVNP